MKPLTTEFCPKSKYGTPMFSTTGQTTTALYMAFHQDDPQEVDKRINKTKNTKRIDYTSGIIEGKPSTKEQQERYFQILAERASEMEKFKNKIFKKDPNESELAKFNYAPMLLF